MSFQYLDPYSSSPASPYALRLAKQSPAGLHAAFGDIDGDGDPDLVLVGAGASQIWRNDGLVGGYAAVDSSQVYSSPGEHTFGALADVDGDGDVDLVTGHFTLAGEREIWLEVWENRGPRGASSARVAIIR